MDISTNISWFLSQPAAFWLTAVLLAILANFATQTIQVGYQKSLSRFKAGQIYFYLKVVNEIKGYINNDKLFEIIILYNIRVIVYFLIFFALMMIEFQFISVNTESGSVGYFIRFGWLLINMAASIYFGYRFISATRAAVFTLQFYEKHRINGDGSTNQESQILFIAAKVGATENQVNSVMRLTGS